MGVGGCISWGSPVLFFKDSLRLRLQRRPTHKVSLFRGEVLLWILGFEAPSRQNPSSGAVKLTLLGPREGSSFLNDDLVVVTAAVHAVAGAL
jgi:hypothetical protein